MVPTPLMRPRSGLSSETTGPPPAGSHVTSSAKNNEGFYTVTFDLDVSGCAYVPAIGGTADSVSKALIGAAVPPSNVNAGLSYLRLRHGNPSKATPST